MTLPGTFYDAIKIGTMENIRKWIYCKPIYGSRVEKNYGQQKTIHQLSQKKERGNHGSIYVDRGNVPCRQFSGGW
jgi:hypothetical protein